MGTEASRRVVFEMSGGVTRWQREMLFYLVALHFNLRSIRDSIMFMLLAALIFMN